MQIDVSKRNKKILILSGVALLLIIFAAMLINFILGRIADAQDSVQIADLGQCATGIDYDMQKWIQKKSYKYVAAQQELAGVSAEELPSQYTANIRSDSCQVSQFVGEDDYSSHSANFIIDIPALQYSFQVVVNYVASGDTAPRDSDLGTPLLYCVSEQDAIYPDFNCADNPLIRAYSGDAVELNDIRNILPYFDLNDHYYVQLAASTETKSGYTIVITYTPTAEDYSGDGIDKYRETYRAEVEEYLRSHGQTLSDYDFFEKWK